MKKTKMFIMSIITLFTLSIPATAYAWDGTKDGKGTHAVITNQAVQILNNNLSQSEPQKVKDNMKILNQYMNDLKLGSTFPDYDPNGYNAYQDHFWDPDTDYNFTHTARWYASYTINETANSQVIKFSALALAEWKKGNYQNATFLLGQATHFLGDINNPYHASNVTAIGSPGHVKYEAYAEAEKEKYLVSTMNATTKDPVYSNIITAEPLSTWIQKNDTYWGKIAKNLYTTKSTLSNSWADWDYSLGQALPNSQKSVALFLYRFINEASGTIPTCSLNVNQLQVVIKTADLDYAGTDDYVYFDFQTKDGQKFIFPLDNPGNDFDRNQTDSYVIPLPKNIDATTITNTSIRKVNYCGDDWKPENFKLIIGGYVKQDVNIPTWLSGNTTYDMPVSIQ